MINCRRGAHIEEIEIEGEVRGFLASISGMLDRNARGISQIVYDFNRPKHYEQRCDSDTVLLLISHDLLDLVAQSCHLTAHEVRRVMNTDFCFRSRN